MSVVPEKYKSAKATNVDLLSFSKLKGKKEMFSKLFDIDNQSMEGKVSIKKNFPKMKTQTLLVRHWD